MHSLADTSNLHLHRSGQTPAACPPPELFKSFWLAGFESAYQINTQRQRIDMLAVTQHDVMAAHDYALLRSIGVRTARDGIRWHLVDRGGRYDFSSFLPMLRAAVRQNLQMIWNLCHYGWPDDIDLFSAAFVDRFARYCRAAVTLLRDEGNTVPYVTPINEISFLAWAIGHKGIIHPYAVGRDLEAKRQLVRAAIAGIEAAWEVEPRTRILHVDPVIHVVPPRDRPDLAGEAAAQRAAQFDAWDMLCGRQAPDLGGHPRYLDVLGINYYHSNQFEHPDVRLRYEDNPRDDRFIPFHQLLAEVHQRYHRPIFVAETSHFGEGRAWWLREMAEEFYQARRRGIPLQGVCLYPIIDRPDWEDYGHWHNSGLWDLAADDSGHLHRVLNQEYAQELRRAQARLRELGCV